MSATAKKSIRDIQDWQGKRVLLRVDYNVPCDDQGRITNDSRIQQTLPTLRYLLERGARLILMAHFGRPKGKVNESMRLTIVAERLRELLPATPIEKADTVFSPEVQAMAEALKPGAVLMLENVRFEPGEEKNDPELAKKLAGLGDIYVNDAFGAAHRAHVSTEGLAHQLPGVAGLLMEKEIQSLSSVVAHPERPFMAIIGGSKVSSKITVLENLLDKVDTLVIGGGMLFTFLKAQGLETGKSLVEEEYLETAKNLIKLATDKNVALVLADDVVIADAFDKNANAKTVPADHIPSDWMGLDIGPQSIQAICDRIAQAKTVLWNGPLGVFEFPKFAEGTRQVADALAAHTESGQCKSILGGGDTEAAIEQFGIPSSRYTHVSTGGGASLEFLEGKELPGIAALADADKPVTV